MNKLSDLLTDGKIHESLQYRAPFINPLQLEQTTNIVNELFKILPGIFPAFRHAWPTDIEFEAAKKEWIKGFMQIGLCDLNIVKKGVERTRLLNRPFIPSIGEFIELCKPSTEDLGIPDLESAWKECKQQISNSEKNFTHPLIKYAYYETGSWDLKHLTEKESYCKFKNHYQKGRDLMINDMHSMILKFNGENINSEFLEINTNEKFMEKTREILNTN